MTSMSGMPSMSSVVRTRGGRVVAIDPGDPFHAVAVRVFPEQDGVPGLDEIVELVRGPAGELLDDLAAARGAEDVGPVQEPGRRVHELDVRLERPADPRSLDLDRDVIAVVEDRAVDLADGGRRERLGRERPEHPLGLVAELLADDLADVGVRERCDLVEQLEQLVAIRHGQQVVAQREHLPELDPRATDRLEGETQTDRTAASVPAGEMERRGDEVPKEHRGHAPDPSRMAEQCPHAAASAR